MSEGIARIHQELTYMMHDVAAVHLSASLSVAGALRAECLYKEVGLCNPRHNSYNAQSILNPFSSPGILNGASKRYG